MKGKNPAFWALLLCAMALVIALVVAAKPTSRRGNGVEQLQFAVGDHLTGQTIADEDRGELDIGSIPGGDRLVIFAWDRCGDCRGAYDSYRLLFALYDSPELNIVFVWDDKIPRADLEAMGVGPGNSYSAMGRCKFTDWVPSYFLLDGGGTLVQKETSLEVMAAYLQERYPVNPQALAVLYPDVELLVLGVDRCGSCKELKESLTAEGKPFQYVLVGQVTSSLYEGDDTVQYDRDGILAGALGLESFPATISLQ